MTTQINSTLHSLPLLGRGKVRDNYAVGEDKLLIVTSDRLSAFDVIMNEAIPDKGRVLNQMANFWFEKLGGICDSNSLLQIGNHVLRWLLKIEALGSNDGKSVDILGTKHRCGNDGRAVG